MTNTLWGVVCLDIYTRAGLLQAGGGILHNAFHLQQLGCEPLLITRIGQERAEVFLSFFERNHISVLTISLVAEGQPASIQIDIQPSGEAHISNFVQGVWQNFCLTPVEEATLAQATHLHVVLTPPVLPEFLRLGQQGKLKLRCVSADFLSFVDFNVEQFTRLLPYLDIAFIGWKGKLSHPTITAIEQAAMAHRVLVVITLGERGVQVFDARIPDQPQSRFFEVEKAPVRENTNGCGDAFIAYFLARYWQDSQLEPAVDQGQWGGRQATQWQFALPDEAY